MTPHRKVFAFLLATPLLLAFPAAGEEFHLKDGTTIVGKIVAYEQDSFRIETSFGFAVIYRDRIQHIVFEASNPEGTAEKGMSSPGRSSAPPEAPGRVTARKADGTAPLYYVGPDEIVERVSGTTYVNETYRFQIFKPPTWRSYPQLVKPSTPLVAALGTPDETTLLLIGREYHQGTLPDYAQRAETSLAQLYEDYRNEREDRTQVDGLSAIERRFTGKAEGRFWTGMAIYFSRGHEYYTLLGLTAAGEQTNLQLSVLRKVTHTLEFLP